MRKCLCMAASGAERMGRVNTIHNSARRPPVVRLQEQSGKYTPVTPVKGVGKGNKKAVSNNGPATLPNSA